ncbi:MAG: phosphonate metabolism transcriptional regulator PhnF [Pseudomonadota bacterium]
MTETIAETDLPLWQQIRLALAGEIAAGRYPPGAQLPTEMALSQRFGVNRHTVRRALAALREAGLVHVRRGAGAFVTHSRIDYRLGRRTRFRQNLTAFGHSAGRRVLRVETIRADAEIARRLDVETGAFVVVFEGVGLADGGPLSHSESAIPAGRLPDIAAHLRDTSSITEALARSGVADYQRAWTRLTAEPAPPATARHLEMPAGAPVLRAEALNVAPDGQPVEYGHTWFHGGRAELVVGEADRPHPAPFGK